jgi:hypothetical protein
MWVNISELRVNGRQATKLDKKKVEKHRRDYEFGNEVFPIDVVQIATDEYCIDGNGRHRYFGAIAAGVTMIEVNVKEE